MEDKIEHPVAIPADVLDALRADKLPKERCLSQVGSGDRIPASWFTASEIHLHDAALADLIVQPSEADPCMGGADNTSYWVFRKRPEGHQLVLTGRSFGLNIMKTRTNGYRDVRMMVFSPRLGEVGTIFKFNGKKYRPSRNYRIRNPS